MRVAFAGPRDYPNLEQVRRRVCDLAPGDSVLYFNRRGAFYRALRDTARERALRFHITVVSVLHVTCDHAIAFVGDDPVVNAVIEAAKLGGIPLEIIGVSA